MNLWFTQFLGKRKSSPACHYENTGFGLRFHFPPSWRKGTLKDAMSSYQYITLQLMLESGDAIIKDKSFHVDNDVLCRLDPVTRTILNLPEPWPGRFELEVHGNTSSPDFSITMRATPPQGRGAYIAELHGPFLPIEGRDYLPDTAQWTALSAVQHHSSLPKGKRKEADNIWAVHALQQACKAGCQIDLRQYATIDVEMPEQVGVSVVENPDGSLRLIPNFGGGLDPDAVEARLHQIRGKADVAVMRVGNKLVLLDERRLKAVNEIISSCHIPAKMKRQFYETPSAFLDGGLVDLELGFSLRVHGIEIFKKAYFGLTESTSLEWFEATGKEPPEVIPLEACAALINGPEELDKLRDAVTTALQDGRRAVEFKAKIVTFEGNLNSIEKIFGKISETIGEQISPPVQPPSPAETKAPGSEEIPIGIGIDGDVIHTNEKKWSALPRYQGDIFSNDIRYSRIYGHQEVGIRWIAGLMQPAIEQQSAESCGGVLADDMGLGKTFMVLAALNIYRRLAEAKGICKPMLAVMPVVLLENWKQEISKAFIDSPFDDVITLQSDADLPRFRQEGAGKETHIREGEDLSSVRYTLKIGSNYIDRLDKPGRLVLTNYDTLRDYQISFCLVDWGCVIFDEAQEIKNPNTIKARAAKGLKADFRLAVTGTPVENSLSDFWCLYDTVLPGLLGAFQDFRRTYMTPINQADSTEKDEKRESLGRKLRNQVGDFMLRRTKEDSLSGLPDKIIHDGTKDSRYSAVMTGIQLERYDNVVSSVMVAKQSDEHGRVQEILLPSLRKLHDISLHPSLHERIDPNLWANPEKADEILCESEKLKLLLQILDEIRERHEKVIIFVINKRLQVFLSEVLRRKYNLDCIYIVNGDTPSVAKAAKNAKATRMDLIQKFEAKEGFNIICMSPLAAGVGLTVVGANNVIHLERHWNPAKEAQATDRVYRIGAERDVHVYIPILYHPTNKSFDVNLNELLRRKVDIKDAVMEVGEPSPKDFVDIFGRDNGGPNPEQRIEPDWLPVLDWKQFEAVCALLARKKYGGEVFLTPRSSDHGADVVLQGEYNILIQCKSSGSKFTDSNVVREPYTAIPEYGKRFNMQFGEAVLAINAPDIDDKVRERAKSLNLSIWDRESIGEMLLENKITYAEVVGMLQSKRLEF